MKQYKYLSGIKFNDIEVLEEGIKKNKIQEERVSLLKAINTIMLNETDEDVIARLVKNLWWCNEKLYS